MKKMIIWTVSAVVSGLLFWSSACWDIWIHPWVSTVVEQWQWWNYFSSEHAFTVLYLTHFWGWICVNAFFSALVAVCITFRLCER